MKRKKGGGKESKVGIPPKLLLGSSSKRILVATTYQDMASSSVYGFPYSAAPLKTVKYVQFGILSPEETVTLIYHRRPCQLQRFSSMKQWKTIDLKQEVCLILEWVQLIGTSNV